MKKTMLVCTLVLLAIPVLATAKDFPLAFKTLNAEQVKGYQWSYGAIQMIVAVKPAALTNEPKAESAHPLYGNFRYRSDKSSMLFRLDESKGDGQGYDTLILDMNRNGNLTDDAAISPAAEVQHWSNYKGQDLTLFGPIEAPASRWIGAVKPVYYAVLDLRTNAIGQLRKNPAGTKNYLGNLDLRAGYYLETTVEMDGRQQTVAVIDNNANMRLGDLCEPITSGGQWYLGTADGDRLLLEKDGSGTNNDSRCFAQILYLDAVPYKVALAADCSSLQVEPWPEPLAEVSLQPHGERVHSLGLGWESAKGQWQFIEPGVANGKIKVPPGNYGLWGVSVSARSPKGGEITAGGGMNTKKVFSVAAGKTNTFLCGTPLEIKVTTDHPDNSSSGGLANWFGKLFSSGSGELRIQAEIVGAGGETYASFSLIDERGQRQPAKPAFTIATADGKQVASGNLEFG
jgi:hypothetical protein